MDIIYSQFIWLSVDVVTFWPDDIDDLVKDCSNSIANALGLLLSCTKPLIYVLPSS